MAVLQMEFGLQLTNYENDAYPTIIWVSTGKIKV
jgi:hypothetical protein